MGDTEEFTSIEWFAGGAGNHQGLSRVIPNLRCIAFCEREGYAVSNLVEEMEAGRMAPAPIWTDCRTFPVEPFLGRRLDLFIASYPCQGESVAGNQLGTEDPRFLWPYCREFVAAVRPVWCFFENVRGHVNTSMVEVLRDLAELQYAVEPGIFSAEECGGSHSRERVFILARDMAYGNHELHDWPRIGRERGRFESANSSIGLADSHSSRRSQPQGSIGELGGWAFNGLETMDDTQGNGCGTRGGEPAREPRRLDASESSGKLADTKPSRLGASRITECGTSDAQSGGGIQLANTLRQRRQQVGGGSHGDENQNEGRGEIYDNEPKCGKQGVSCSPPGPNDADGWYRVLFGSPWLAPSLRRSEAERIFRRVADVVANEPHLHPLRSLFCENRVDRLRMLGNGVFPESAATAWLALMGKMEANFYDRRR